MAPSLHSTGAGAATSRKPRCWEPPENVFAYFDGELTEFDLPLAPAGTAFQCRVWDALCAHPVWRDPQLRRTRASRLGSAARAVGQANAANPIPILIPCHRVVASGGIGGYSGGDGLVTKRACWRWKPRAGTAVRRQPTSIPRRPE